MRRQVGGQRLGRALGLDLLGEGEQRVEDDDDDDRPREHRDPGDEGEHRRGPEQQRQRMGELLAQLARMPRPLAALDRVRAVLGEAASGLARAQSGGRDAELVEQLVEVLLGIDVALLGKIRGLSIGAHRRLSALRAAAANR